ncbi:MAG: metallophosphoesterase [Deltaproteobacteria bacterium]|nr:metallophosphoesterase [Deltaproteobacteria bacterium]
MARREVDTLRIAHLSDLHLPLTQSAPVWSLMGKRALGWFNLKMLRGNTHRLDVFLALLADLAEQSPDVVVITGDLVNLAYDFEFAEVARLLEEAGLDPARCVLVPGNHDRYTAGADRGAAFEKGMSDWLPPGLARRDGYPWLRKLGPICVLALDSAVWRGPARAAGRLADGQLERLAGLLDGLDDSCHPVLAMHHPPIRLRGPALRDYRAGLSGFEGLFRVLGRRPATVLHGHLHRIGRSRRGAVEILGAPSASNDCGRSEDQAAYHLLTFSSRGLLSAQARRFWPGRVEVQDLPDEALLR